MKVGGTQKIGGLSRRRGLAGIFDIILMVVFY